MIKVISGDQNGLSRFWCGTQFNLAFDFQSVSGLQYCVYQKERCPDSGREHYQWHAEFKERKRFTAVSKLLSGAHVERVRELEASRKYAQKEGSRVDGPWFVGRVEEGKRKFDAVCLLKTSSVEYVISENPGLWRSVRALRDIRSMFMPKRKELTGLVYIHGPTGCGKSYKMTRFAKFMDLYYQDSTKWWNGYEQQPIVVVDEYHGEFSHKFMLRLGDYTPLQVETKGGSVEFNSIWVVFLSNLPPEQTVFTSPYDSVNQALRRRFSIISM